MSTKKATKRALLTSILAICLCLVMLIGSTFAWFTDTASTSVNKIESGTLKVALEMKDGDNWVNAEGKTLSWVQASADAAGNPTTSLVDGKDILWEPGCTYELQPIRVRNDGNLALKYKIEITGIVGDVGLNKVIDWKINGEDIALTEQHLIAGAVSDPLVITGHMQESANNDYQNLTIDGIAITVYATQDTVENDSFTNRYDENATYPMATLSKIEATMTATGENYTYTNTGATIKVVVPKTAVTLEDGKVAPTVTVEPTKANDTASAAIAAAGKDAVAYDIKVSDVTAGNTDVIEVSLFIGKNLDGVVVYHEGDAMDTDDYSYDAATGFVTIKTTSFSVFTFAFNVPAAMLKGVAYDTLADAIGAAQDGDTVVLMKSGSGNGIVIPQGTFADKGLTIDFNKNSYIVGGVLVGSSGTASNAFQLLKGNKITFMNGAIYGDAAVAGDDTTDWRGAPAIMIQNYSSLTLKNMTIVGGKETCYTLSNNCGDTVIEDSTITAGQGTTYPPMAFDVCRYASYPSVSVTVRGNSVINGNVEVSGKIGEGQSRQLTIENGTFNGKFVVSNTPHNIVIKGGTFSSDPTAYLAEGFVANQNGNTWTVTAQ